MSSTSSESSSLLGFASPSHLSETVFAFYPGTSCTLTPESFSDYNKLQCVELSLPVGHLAGGDLFHLHFEAWD